MDTSCPRRRLPGLAGVYLSMTDRMGAVEGWVVTHDGETVKTGFKHDGEAMKWLHDQHSYSVDHAVKYEAYDIVLVRNGKVEWSYKRDLLKPKKRPMMGANVWIDREKVVELLQDLREEIAKVPEGERNEAVHLEIERAIEQLSE